MKLIRGLLVFNGLSPVELPHHAPVTQHQLAAVKLHRQTNDQRAKHILAARRVLVGFKVSASSVDVDGVELGRDGIGSCGTSEC